MSRIRLISFAILFTAILALNPSNSKDPSPDPGQQLNRAILSNNVNEVKRLIPLVNINEPLDDDGNMALDTAVIMPWHSGIVELLLENHASVNSFNAAGLTPLQMAAGCGFYERVKLLIDHGARVNLKTSDGRAALHMATKSCDCGFGKDSKDTDYVKTISLLLEHGANPNAKNEKGQTPKDLLGKGPNREKVIQMLDQAAQRNRTPQ